jgi:DNA transformation protein
MNPFRPDVEQTLRSFYEVPVDVLEDGEQLTTWAARAVSRK